MQGPPEYQPGQKVRLERTNPSLKGSIIEVATRSQRLKSNFKGTIIRRIDWDGEDIGWVEVQLNSPVYQRQHTGVIQRITSVMESDGNLKPF